MTTQVLVAIMNNKLDFAIARDKHWYRIPVSSMKKWLSKRWPPRWLAFYQTKIFGPEKYSINYYARVLHIQRATREQLFPGEYHGKKAQKVYYQLMLEPLRKLPQPIFSRRWRRIVFIPTTWEKFIAAVEINDLYDDSPLEDRLWAEFKRLQINVQRQFFVEVEDRSYALDFAAFCDKGDLAIETDGDTWHSNPERASKDNLRDNDLKSAGWKVLRFNTAQIKEEIQSYCVPTIVKNINRLGGIDEGRLIPRQIDLDGGSQQLSLFDDL